MMKSMEISILGFRYKVYIDEDKLRNVCEEEDIDLETILGFHVAHEKTIYLSERLKDDQIVQTLLHELLHAIGSIAGHEKLAHSTTKNEFFVNSIANGLLTVFKNQKLYLFVGMKLGHLKKEE